MSFQNAGAIPRVKNAESTMMTVMIRLSAILLMARISLSHLSWSNVTGQRTRHLVAGTLDPIVGALFHFGFRNSRANDVLISPRPAKIPKIAA